MNTPRLLAAAFLLISLSENGWSAKQTEPQLEYMNGIIAVVEDRIITADDVRREMAPLVQQLRGVSDSPKLLTSAPQGSQSPTARAAGNRPRPTETQPIQPSPVGKASSPSPNKTPEKGDQPAPALAPAR